MSVCARGGGGVRVCEGGGGYVCARGGGGYVCACVCGRGIEGLCRFTFGSPGNVAK